MPEKVQSLEKDGRYRPRQHSQEEKKRQKREWKKRLQEERKRKRRDAKRGTSAVVDMPDVRQNQIDETSNDDLEYGDFLNAKLKCNPELLEDEGASEEKRGKLVITTLKVVHRNKSRQRRQNTQKLSQIKQARA